MALLSRAVEGEAVSTRYPLGSSGRCLLRVALDAQQHRGQSDLAAGEADAIHDLSREIIRDGEHGRGRLVVDGGKEYREECGDRGRLPDIEVCVVMHFPVVKFREEINPRLALWYGKRRAVELAQSIRQGFEALRVSNERL